MIKTLVPFAVCGSFHPSEPLEMKVESSSLMHITTTGQVRDLFMIEA